MLRYTTRHYIRLHYTIPHYTTQHYSTLQYTTLHNYTTPQLQLQLQVQLHYTYYTLQLQLHYTTLQLQLQLPAPHYIQQLWVRCTTATIANCPKNTTSTTFRSISRFALPSVIVPKELPSSKLGMFCLAHRKAQALHLSVQSIESYLENGILTGNRNTVEMVSNYSAKKSHLLCVCCKLFS